MRRIFQAKPGLTVAVKALPVSPASSSWLVDARLMAQRKVFIVNVNAHRTVRHLGHTIRTPLEKIIGTLQKIDFQPQPRSSQ